MDGECTTQLFYMLTENPVVVNTTLNLPEVPCNTCCSAFQMNVLANVTGSVDSENDVSGFLYWFKDAIDTAVIKLYKGDVLKASLNASTYGTFSALGFYTNSKGDKYIGFQLSWKQVLIAFGSGIYTVKVDYHSAITGLPSTYTSNEFNLNQYTPARANGTVRIEYTLNSVIGDNSDDKLYREFTGLNWKNQIRIPAYFGSPGSTYQDDYIQYGNGLRAWVTNEQEPEYRLTTKMLPAYIHELLRTDVRQADEVLITDYNASNPNTYIKKNVRCNSEYKPTWSQQSKLAKVELTFVQAYNNLKNHRC